MIVSATLTGVEGLAERIARALAPRLAEDAVAAAAVALTTAAAREGVTLEAQAGDGGVRLGTDDPEAVAREAGTLEQPADPWLQPALSGMRRRR